MRISKLDISEKLVEGYVKVPLSLKEQAITSLAIQLCHTDELKKDIFQRKLLSDTHDVSWYKWYMSIDVSSTYVCQKLPLPSALQKLLVVPMRTIALQLYDWTWQQEKFILSPLSADSFLIRSDWLVVEVRLDEQKIAKRLVQDERIPLVQRFRMACFYCLEIFILSLWNQISHEDREGFFQYDKNTVVNLWYSHLSGEFNELFPTPSEGTFWRYLLKRGIFEGSLSSVLQSWSKLKESIRQEILIDTAMDSAKIICVSHYSIFKAPSSDILCFLLTCMSKEQRILFFQRAFQYTKDCVLVCFLRWPYLDLLIPIINELWAVLPVMQYTFLLFILARMYSDTNPYPNQRRDYMDYDYGYLIIDLLEETPDHFKRYVFGNNYHYYTNPIPDGKILFTILRKGVHKIQYREVFKRIWQHITLEERRLFLKSHYGKAFCCDLAKQDYRGPLTSILIECLPENEILLFKKTFLDINWKYHYF